MKDVKSHSIQCSCLLLVCRNILLPSLPPSLSMPSSLYSASNVRSVFSRQCDVCKQEGQLYIKHIIASSASDASKIQPAIIARSHHGPASVALPLLTACPPFQILFPSLKQLSSSTSSLLCTYTLTNVPSGFI